MPTASPRRVSRLRCCFYSSTNVCAGLSPTAASTTSRTSNTAQTASSNSPTTAPTKQSNTSSICSPPPDLLVVNVELFLSRSCEAVIYLAPYVKLLPLRQTLRGALQGFSLGL